MSEYVIIDRTYREEWLLRLTGREKSAFVIDGDVTLDFHSFYELAVGLSNSLFNLGIRSKQNVAIRATRGVDSLLFIHALLLLGTKIWLLDNHLGAKAFLQGLGFDHAPDWIISNEKKNDGAARNGGWELLSQDGKITELDELTAIRPALEFVSPQDFTNHEAGLLIFTSGSTGKSKGAFLSQYNMLNHIENFGEAYDAQSYDHDMQTLPLYHVYGLCLSLMAFRKGYSIYFPDDIAFPNIAKDVSKMGITLLNTVPTYALGFASYLQKEGIKLTTLRLGCVAGAPITVDQFRYVEEITGVSFYPVYGETECIGITSLRKGDSQQKRASTVGRWLKAGESRIAAEDDSPLGVNEVGEVQVKTPAVFEGYYLDEEGTKEAFTRDGFLHSGDLGYLDEEGYLHLVGRKKAIIIKNGNNISAEKVENAIESLPYVSSCVVVGTKSEKLGEEVCAYIVMKETERRSEEEIKQALADKLFKNEIPDRIKFGDTMPLNSAMKKDKQKVKAMFN